uniref:HAT C-terminal dimerisation domain-containing protein n=1 Tax=Nothobranchius kadleci TaxID=1051664 RepID=A0A1A8CP43_NOTKA
MTPSKRWRKRRAAVHAAQHLCDLQEKLLERKAALFMGLKVKSILATQERPQVEVFKQSVHTFYEGCISYLQEWSSSFTDMKCFSWTLLEDPPGWDEVESSLRYVSSKLPNIHINETELFDEVTSVKTYTSDKIGQWDRDIKPADERWAEIFTHFKHQNVPFKNVAVICQFAMCLPGTNASVERIFSLMNNTWTNERNRLGLETLKALLITRVNFDGCSEFHARLVDNHSLLKKIHSNMKYS